MSNSPKNRDAVMRALLATLAVACMLTAYEIIFFYRIVVPGVRSQIISALKVLRGEVHSLAASEYAKRTDPASFELMIETAKDEAEDAAGTLLEKLVDSAEDETAGGAAGAARGKKNTHARFAVAEALAAVRRKRRAFAGAPRPVAENVNAFDASVFADSLSDEIRGEVDKMTLAAVDKVKAAVLTIMDRETLLRNRVNRFAMMSACFIVVALAVAILFVYFELDRDENGERPGVLGLAVTPVATVVVIIFFQYAFYRLGVAFEYPGKQGPHDEISVIADALLIPGKLK